DDAVTLPEEVSDEVERMNERIGGGRESPESFLVGELGRRHLFLGRRRLLAHVDQGGAGVARPVTVRVADPYVAELAHFAARLPRVDRPLRFARGRIAPALVAEHVNTTRFVRKACQAIAFRSAQCKRLLGEEMRNA